MLTKEQEKNKKIELIKLLKQNNKSNFLDKFIEHILKNGMSCDNCKINDTCPMSYDAYNTHGDCIMLK